MFHKFVAVALSAMLALIFIVGCATGAPRLLLTQDSDSQQDETSNDAGDQEPAAAVDETDDEPHPALLDPSLAAEQAPETYRVLVDTTKGQFVIEVVRAQSPNGADRFYNLVDIGYFEDIAVFRAIDGFMFQFGIHGDPEVASQWSESTIMDDANAGITNAIGTITFAKTGLPNSRSTQLFINLGNNDGLDRQGFTPFGAVVQGMDVVRSINTEYGENRRRDNVQGNLKAQGNEWVREKFPNLDFINSITLMDDDSADGSEGG
ncbi:MAG: peptidylprolyl isomerase [Planctomycetota bacterium]